MRLRRIGLTAAAIFVLFIMASRAEAVILASDDFSGPGSGIGWAAGNSWEGLVGGRISTAGNVVSFRDFAAPINGTNQVTYIRFDFTQSVPGTGAQWGGASFFEGLEAAGGGTETFFAGDPGDIANYGLDLHPGSVNSGVAINNQQHTIIAAIDTTPAGATANYRIWVDNFNVGTPSGTGTIANSPIDAAWGTFRFGADGTNTDFFDNLTIATTFREVGLVPEPVSLGLICLSGVAILSMNRRRR